MGPLRRPLYEYSGLVLVGRYNDHSNVQDMIGKVVADYGLTSDHVFN